MWLDPITVRIELLRTVDLRAWRDLLPWIGNTADTPCFFHPYRLSRALRPSACRLPGGYSNLEPLLPIPNRTVKRVCADDSVHSHAKVGHRQTIQREARSP